MDKHSYSNAKLIKLVEDTFTQVNLKIDYLLDCSVKDFILLNSGFKEYHSLLNGLSNSTNSFFKFILSSKYDIEITKQCVKAEKDTQALKNLIDSQLTELKGLNNKYNLILLNTTNLKQVISTLQLLFTNLRFDPSYTLEQNKISEHINKLSENYLICENRVKKLFDKLKKLTNFSEEGYQNSLEIYSDIIKKIINQITLSTSIRTSSIKFEKQIAEIEERKTSSTSEIITNLQFQDILRQKIEHIQEAQTNITKNLFSEHKSDSKLNLQELFQIRDISSLQSALLVHANQEYQNAVENILKRISEMRQLINNYSAIWNHFCIPEKVKIKNILLKVNEDLTLLHSQSFSLMQFSEKYVNLLMEISNIQNETSEHFNSTEFIDKNIIDLEKLLNTAEIRNEDTQQFSPINQLKEELFKFRNGYNKLTTLLNDFNSNIFTNYISNFEKFDLSTQKLNDNSNIIAKLIKVYGLGVDKDVSSAEFSESVAEFGVDQIEYYKSFEREVKDMINLFDKLLNKVNLNKSDVNKNELDHLKEIYTMQSERDVHEKLTKEKNRKLDKNNNKDNEVEFF